MGRLRFAFVFLFVVGFAAVGAPAKEKVAAKGKKVVLKGHLVDVACLNERMHGEGIGDLGHKHTKGCLQMPACEESGFAVLDAQQNVIKFDAAGNRMVKSLVAKTTKDEKANDWRVVVHGRQSGDTVAVTRIQLAK